MRFVTISDTHHKRPEVLPAGDVLVHAGDLTGNGAQHRVLEEISWLAEQPHRYKIVVPGNHDWDTYTFPSAWRAPC